MAPLYRSTRGFAGEEGKGLSFKEVVLLGLAPDGGLFVPTVFPQVTEETFNKWKKAAESETLTFQSLAYDIIRMFIPEEEVPNEVLKDIINRSYSTFRSDKVTPVRKLKKSGLYILELFHGPTFAFKDVALQFLGNLFEYFISSSDKKINVLGATSGDTGSSAIHGLRGKKNVEVFILFPEGRVSNIQELQMTTVTDPNVHCLALEGSFDDAQAIVKKLFRDEEFRNKVNLSAVNSINFGRILAQIVYYFYAHLVIGREAVFSVPTGNFGDILAGYYAMRMGLPVKCLVVATNSNDILYRFFTDGDYSKPAKVIHTTAPSMDICVSSNFERYLYHMMEEDTERVNELMKTFEDTGKIDGNIVKVGNKTLLEKCKEHMETARLSDMEIREVISTHYKIDDYVLDTHSACGVGAIDRLGYNQEHTLVCLACAHWGKFSNAVGEAIGQENLKNLSFPPELEALKAKTTRKHVLAADPKVVKEFMLDKHN